MGRFGPSAPCPFDVALSPGCWLLWRASSCHRPALRIKHRSGSRAERLRGTGIGRVRQLRAGDRGLLAAGRRRGFGVSLTSSEARPRVLGLIFGHERISLQAHAFARSLINRTAIEVGIAESDISLTLLEQRRVLHDSSTVSSDPSHLRPACCASRMKAEHADQGQSDSFALSFAHG